MRCILGFWIFLIWLETVVLSVFCYTEIKPSINCSFLANYSGCERKTFPESLHPNVDCIDLSGNMLTYVNKIEGLDNLFYMDLSSNILKTVDNGAFASLRKLEYLDISNNEHLGLAVLPNVTNGLNQTNIKVLKVDQISCPGGRSNILQRHHLSYLDNTSLLELSIATNRIETLEPCVLSRLPKSIKRLSIARNRLIAAAYVLEYHSLVNVEVINASLRNSPFPFLRTISGSLYRNRWKIRYMRYTLFQRARDSHLLSSSSDDLFLYDAFVSYTSKDRDFVIKDMIQKLEQDNGVQLLIRDRSFIPGEFKCQQIVRSIQESRKTICVVSKRYLKSAWRDYELNMARVEGVEVRKSMRYVILILLPEVCNGGYPKKISDFLKRDCFIEYPDDPAGYEEFWQRLCSALQENAQD
nr:toll-like receptor 4 [Crassostrea gigas]